MKRPTVNVVMSTYNGSAHITKQLESILNQTYPSIQIYIRDDGSTDNTVEILRDFGNRFDNIHILSDTDGNLGVPGSFYKLLRDCGQSDFYAFADQDDIWLPDKIKWAVQKLYKLDKTKPLLYVSSYDYYTSDGRFIRRFPRQDHNVRFDRCLYYSIASGFTMVFNETARRICLPPEGTDYKELHDRRFQRTVAAFGQIVVDDRASARHIRYDDSVTSNDSDNKALFSSFIKNELCGDEMKREKKYLQEFSEQYYSLLSNKNQKILKLFADDSNSTIIKMKKIFYPHRLRARMGGELALRLLFMAGKM